MPNKKFLLTPGHIRIFGAGYWHKGKKFMRKPIQYSNESLGDIEFIPDFLPSPEADLEISLKYQEEGRQITLQSHTEKGRLLEDRISTQRR